MVLDGALTGTGGHHGCKASSSCSLLFGCFVYPDHDRPALGLSSQALFSVSSSPESQVTERPNPHVQWKNGNGVDPRGRFLHHGFYLEFEEPL